MEHSAEVDGTSRWETARGVLVMLIALAGSAFACLLLCARLLSFWDGWAFLIPPPLVLAGGVVMNRRGWQYAGLGVASGPFVAVPVLVLALFRWGS